MTPSIILFFSVAALLSVLLALMVILPWFKAKKANDNQLLALNVQVFETRIAELLADKQAGKIDDVVFDAYQAELKRQLIAAQTYQQSYPAVSKKSRIIVMVWIPILAILAYLMTSDRTSVFKLWTAQDTVGQIADDLLTGKLDTPPDWAKKDSIALISAMQTNVYQHAYDPNRWMRLSELFLALDAQPQAVEALARAYRLNPTDSQIAMTYAQTSFFANNGILDNSAKNAVLEILKTTPDHEGALMMMAMGEMRAGNLDAAKAWIARLRTHVATKSGDRSQALQSLDELTAKINEQEQNIKQGVVVSVFVDKSLLAEMQKTDTLFVSISDSQGGAPYAVKKLSANELTSGKLNVSLSDLDAMMPEHTLSAAQNAGKELIVRAHISKSGTAATQKGDLLASPIVLGKKQQTAELNINQVAP